MGLILGSGGRRASNPQSLLGIRDFDASKAYSKDNLVMYNGNIYRFLAAKTAGAEWDPSIVRQCATGTIIASLVDPRFKPFLAEKLAEGDMLFYDRALGVHCTVSKDMVAAVLADYDNTRFETNFDTFIGTFSGVAHFVARNDAAGNGFYDSDTAATACYYRIEIDNTKAGHLEFSATSGSASIASTSISWDAGDAMSDITAKFKAKNDTYITFADLEDGTGVGLSIGGWGANTLTVTDSLNCTVIDCSTLAFRRSLNPAAPKVGETMDPNSAFTFLGNEHHNFRGSTASSILPGQGLVGASTSCIGQTGHNYSTRTGVNFAKFKDWADGSGDSTFYDDGEGGSNDSSSKVMNEATFNAEVRDYSGADEHHLGMKEYYTHLFSDQTGDYAVLRREYEAQYGQMESMYDAYLMSHMMDVAANSGITNSMRNKGENQTRVKGDVMNVTYNYAVIPAYPPEYNALQYGISTSEGFVPGVYYHPEPGDIGLMFRDDIMALVNANIDIAGGTKLTNGMYRGSSADDYGYNAWSFHGARGCFSLNNRYYAYFRSRPVLALPLPN